VFPALGYTQSMNSDNAKPPVTLAVIVPTLNEAEGLPLLLAALASEPVEVVVVDGGSTDATADIARAADVRFVSSARGRALQMNAGAAASSADALLFLHADSLPPAGFANAALSVLADPSVALGAFRFSLGGGTASLRLIEWGTNLRSRWAHLPYGDQGLFFRRPVFDELGGFPDIPVMEDYDLVRQARRAGSVVITNTAVVTSDRRWRELGPWRYTALNTATVVRRRLGATPQQLAKWRASKR
jgi:rSAM/selenodomain-associated transferase 2